MKSKTIDWALIQKVKPHADIFSDHVVLHDVRDFAYRTEQDCDESYKEFSLEFSKLTGATYFVVPFGPIPGSAHVFVSFSFSNSEPIAISFEARRKVGESFNPIVGLFNMYELMAVIGTERDVVYLREVCRKDIVYRYPLKLSQEQLKKLFIELLTKANSVNQKEIPERYNTLTNTCMTCLLDSFNSISENKISYALGVLLPAYSPKILETKGLITRVQS